MHAGIASCFGCARVSRTLCQLVEYAARRPVLMPASGAKHGQQACALEVCSDDKALVPTTRPPAPMLALSDVIFHSYSSTLFLAARSSEGERPWAQIGKGKLARDSVGQGAKGVTA